MRTDLSLGCHADAREARADTRDALPRASCSRRENLAGLWWNRLSMLKPIRDDAERSRFPLWPRASVFGFGIDENSGRGRHFADPTGHRLSSVPPNPHGFAPSIATSISVSTALWSSSHTARNRRCVLLISSNQLVVDLQEPLDLALPALLDEFHVLGMHVVGVVGGLVGEAPSRSRTRSRSSSITCCSCSNFSTPGSRSAPSRHAGSAFSCSDPCACLSTKITEWRIIRPPLPGPPLHWRRLPSY